MYTLKMPLFNGHKRASMRNYFCLLLFIFTQLLLAQTPVAKHGALRTSGNKILDKNNQTFSLAGNSLFWSQAGGFEFNGTTDFYNKQTVDHLADDWKSDVVRVAMGVSESWDSGSGYIGSPAAQEAKIRKVIDAAIAKDIYVIIDWHTHEAEKYTQESAAFFKKMARIYGQNDHVIYEIYNEPIGQSWNTIKNYAQTVISAIRSEDPDNLIIVGTPTWSQDVDRAAADPINDNNVAYTLHFYSGTHKQSLRDKAQSAINNGIALFVTEWGTVNADGNGVADRPETQRWLDFLKNNGISHVNWSVADKNEGASVVSPGAGVSGLRNDQLTANGEYAKSIIEGWNSGGNATTPNPNPTPAPIPTPAPSSCNGSGSSTGTIIQAEAFCAQMGIQTENTQDTGGGRNIGYIDNGDYVRYRVNIPSNGNYEVTYRVASIVGTGKIEFKTDGTRLTTTNVPNTGNWQSWRTITTDVTLTAGSKTIELFANSGRYNINWFQITKKESSTNPTPTPTPTPIPTPTPTTPIAENCSFGAPIATPLASIRRTSFEKIYVLGNDGPDLSAVTNFTINWDVQNNGLYQFSMNTNTGVPSYWIDLINKATHDFNSSNPSIKLVGTGISRLDGSYWVNRKGNDFVMVAKNGQFTIYFSNSNSAPTCNALKAVSTGNDLNFTLYPNPANGLLNINGLQEETTIHIVDIMGRTMINSILTPETNTIDITRLVAGNYFITFVDTNNLASKSLKFLKVD